MKNYQIFSYRRKYILEMRDVSLVACSVSTNSSKIKEYQLKLQKHSSNVTKKALKNARTTKSFMDSILWSLANRLQAANIVNCVLKLLHCLKGKGWSYSIIKSARWTLSAFITLERLEMSNHFLLCWYMKGFRKTKPS